MYVDQNEDWMKYLYCNSCGGETCNIYGGETIIF